MKYAVLAFALSLAIFAAACDKDDKDGNGGTTSEVSFAGEQSAFPEFSKDTGWQPNDSPIQVKMVVSATGKLTAGADALVGGSASAPIMSGKAGTGKFNMLVKFVFKVLIKVDVAGAQYEGPVDENADIEFEFGGEATFDPFLVGETVNITTDVPETLLATIPLGAVLGVPGLTGDLIIHIAGTAKSDFSGVCATISEDKAQYTAKTITSADLILKPSIYIKIPFVLEETMDAFDIPVPVPPTEMAMDLGVLDVSPGGGAVDGGGSLATVGSCDGTVPPTDVVTGEGIVDDKDMISDEDTTGGDDVVEPPQDVGDKECEDYCNGCCKDNQCFAGNNDEVCGKGGEQCQACPATDFCNGGVCEVIPVVEDCAADCEGCCDGETCMSGKSNSACGKDGADCESCLMGWTCKSGVCEEGQVQECSETCDGCCNNDLCFPGDKNYACGTGGVECEMCNDGFLCIEGSCQEEVIEECWATCDGCCVGDDCYPGTDDEMCGLGGEECYVCPHPSICDPGGGCGVDLSGAWNIVVLDAHILMDSPSGGWDEFGGAPDIYVTVDTYDAAGEIDESGSTSVMDDTYFAEFNETVVTAVNGFDIFNYGIAITMYDSDGWLKDDYISSCSGAVDLTAFVGVPMDMCGFGEEMTVNVIFEPF